MPSLMPARGRLVNIFEEYTGMSPVDAVEDAERLLSEGLSHYAVEFNPPIQGPTHEITGAPVPLFLKGEAERLKDTEVDCTLNCKKGSNIVVDIRAPS